MATVLSQASLDAAKPGDGVTPAVIFESFDLPASNQRLLGEPHLSGTAIPLALRPSVTSGLPHATTLAQYIDPEAC